MKKAKEKVRISRCNFGRIVICQKGKMREYIRDDNTNTVKMSRYNKQGTLDAKTRRVFRELAEMILLGFRFGLRGDD